MQKEYEMFNATTGMDHQRTDSWDSDLYRPQIQSEFEEHLHDPNESIEPPVEMEPLFGPRAWRALLIGCAVAAGVLLVMIWRMMR